LSGAQSEARDSFGKKKVAAMNDEAPPADPLLGRDAGQFGTPRGFGVSSQSGKDQSNSSLTPLPPTNPGCLSAGGGVIEG
jgi:hypothetical protein